MSSKAIKPDCGSGSSDTSDSKINGIQEIINYIEDNMLEALTPDRIAASFYMSVSALNVQFKFVCGITVMEYIRNRRLTISAQELLTTKILIIELAYKYGYETPEAFTKAFVRFHGFPPSFVRRTYPRIKVYDVMNINFELRGGWVDTSENLPKLYAKEQEHNLLNCYDESNKLKGETQMENKRKEYQLYLKDMQQQEDWRILLSLACELDQKQIKFKVDGKTMIFAHGLEFKLEKICLTFKWNDESLVKEFFQSTRATKSTYTDEKYFDEQYKGMKIRCMFYSDLQDYDTDEALFRNADCVMVDEQQIHVQSLEFYYENAEPNNVYYRMVEEKLGYK